MCSDLKTLAMTIFYWGMFIIYAYFLKCLCCFSISSFSSWQSHTWIIPHINPVPGSLTTTRHVEAVYSAGSERGGDQGMPVPMTSGHRGWGAGSQVWALPLGFVTWGRRKLSVPESVFLRFNARITILPHLTGCKKNKTALLTWWWK